MDTVDRRELERILGAIREVEGNLDRRDARAYGAVLVMWGLVTAACFAFSWAVYQRGDAVARYGAFFLTWFWVPPVAVASVVSLFVGARRWRLDEREARDVRIWRFLAAVGAPVALTVLFLLGNLWWLVAATWVTFLGVYFLMPGWRDGERLARLRRALAFGLFAVAAGIVVVRPRWAYLATAAALLVGLGGFGLAKYLRGE